MEAITKPVLHRFADGRGGFFCPNCYQVHRTGKSLSDMEKHEFNGDMVRPSFSAECRIVSYNCKSEVHANAVFRGEAEPSRTNVCHFMVDEGEIYYFPDTTSFPFCGPNLAGLTMDMIPWAKNGVYEVPCVPTSVVIKGQSDTLTRIGPITLSPDEFE